MVVLDIKYYKIMCFDRQILPLNTSLHKNDFIDLSLLRASYVSKKLGETKKTWFLENFDTFLEFCFGTPI